MRHRTVPMKTRAGQPESHAGAWGMLAVFLTCIGFIVAGVAFVNHVTLR